MALNSVLEENQSRRPREYKESLKPFLTRVTGEIEKRNSNSSTQQRVSLRFRFKPSQRSATRNYIDVLSHSNCVTAYLKTVKCVLVMKTK